VKNFNFEEEGKFPSEWYDDDYKLMFKSTRAVKKILNMLVILDLDENLD